MRTDTVTLLERLCVSLSEQFDAMMRARRMTQRKLAWRSGRVHYGTVANVLKAKNTRVSTLVDLADGLDCDIEIRLIPRG